MEKAHSGSIGRDAVVIAYGRQELAAQCKAVVNTISHRGKVVINPFVDMTISHLEDLQHNSVFDTPSSHLLQNAYISIEDACNCDVLSKVLHHLDRF